MNYRLKLCPQFKTYDDIRHVYCNFLMFVQSPGIRSSVCNTDIYGMRFNSKNNLYPTKSIFEEYLEFSKNNDEQNIVLGGSQVFGIGSTDDQNTIPSILSKITGNYFCNLGGRAFNGTQEIIQFLLLINNFNNLKKIIVISGINDLFMFSNNAFLNNFPGPIYNNQFFIKSLKDLGANFKDKIIRKLKLKKDLHLDKFPEITLKDIIKRNIEIWSMIAKGLNIKLDFYLSPYVFWAKKNALLSKEEKVLINNKTEYDRVYEKLNNSYSLVHDEYDNCCKEKLINFYDLNKMLFKFSEKKEWLFTDRVHLTDLGYKYCAEFISEKSY